MQTIYKYRLGITDTQIIELPKGYQVLKVDEQYGELHIWALINTAEPLTSVKIRIFGTGHHVREKDGKALTFLGTAVMSDGFVWHVFRVEE